MSIEHSGESNGLFVEEGTPGEDLVTAANEEARITISMKWCKGCKICVEYCPTDVLELINNKAKVVRLDDCIKCRTCEDMCPDFAITIDKLDKK